VRRFGRKVAEEFARKLYSKRRGRKGEEVPATQGGDLPPGASTKRLQEGGERGSAHIGVEEGGDLLVSYDPVSRCATGKKRIERSKPGGKGGKTVKGKS